MNKIILLIIFLVYELNAYSQRAYPQVRDTSWYVELKDSTVLYSKKLVVKYSLNEGEYLLLDRNKKIPMSDVLRYRSRTGEYIRERGPVERYRIENSGPRLFVYSRAFWYSDSSGYHKDRHYFFRKDEMDDMQEMTYRNLKDAMADNAASIRQLEASKTTMVIAGVGGTLGFLLAVIGGAQSFKKNTDRFNTSVPSTPGFPVRPGQPLPAPQRIKPSTSPLLIAGPIIMVGAMITLFTAPGHIHKAIRIYNQ